MSIEYSGRVAIVTGAGAGLGRSHALSLAARGARVVINDPGRSKTQGATVMVADVVVDEIKKTGGVAVANYEAVGEFDAAQRLVKQAVEEFGRVDILVNNAGILKDKSFIKMTEDDWTQVLKVHLSGTA
ncbi:MAG: SDR family NAD(P)-dependent oxidoreductase, partial [Anaerolineales bacterium]|nr:SDR family NAD(P)-dependent oxidoreductase [Anaerolineales bacterium]